MKMILWIIAAALLCAVPGCQIVTVPMSAAHLATHNVAVGGLAQPDVYSKTELKELNERMEASGIPVTLADTYMAAYRTPFEMLPPKGDTGDLSGSMESTNRYFHRILAEEGVRDPEEYLITEVETAQEEGWTLFALVHRPEEVIRVKKKLDPSIKLTLQPREDEYYLPYRTEANGTRLDVVLDWAAVPNECFAAQSQQAILLTLNANEVLKRETDPRYWKAEEKWLAGDFMDVVKKQDKKACNALGIEEGFTVRMPRKG